MDMGGRWAEFSGNGNGVGFWAILGGGSSLWFWGVITILWGDPPISFSLNLKFNFKMSALCTYVGVSMYQFSTVPSCTDLAGDYQSH